MFIVVNIFYIRHLASRDSRRPHNANVCKVSPIRDVPYPKKTDKSIDFAKGYFICARAMRKIEIRKNQNCLFGFILACIVVADVRTVRLVG